MNTTVKLYDNMAHHMMNHRPDTVVELIEWLKNLLEEVPSEYHDQVLFEIMPLNEDEVEEEVSYVRPETEEEALARQKVSNDQKRRQEEWERQKYEELKAKFES